MTARPVLAAALAASACAAVFAWAGDSSAGQLLTKRQRRLLEERNQVSPPPADRRRLQELYEDLQAAFLGQDPTRAELLSRQYLALDPSSARAGEALYLQGLARIQSGQTAQARESLARLTANPVWKRWAEEARISVADSYWKEGDAVRARAAYEEALRQFPRSEWAGYVRARLRSFEVPDLPLQPAAEEESFFTVQVGSFAAPDNARKLLSRLAAANYDAYLAPDPERGITRVRVGRFPARAGAETLAARLRSDGLAADVVR